MMRTRHICCLFLALVLILPAFGLSAATENDVRTLTCFINHTWYPVDSFTGFIPEEITRRTGIALEITVAQNYQQLNQLIAQDRLPDIVYTSTQLDKMSSKDLCYSYDELLREYGLAWDMPRQLRANALAYSTDGQVYALINNFACTEDWQNTSAVPMISSLMVRQDILNAMDIREIHTTEELFQVFLRVRDEYPDMVPLTFDSVHRFNVFRCYFGMGLLPFLEQEDGTWLHYSRDARYREMLVFLNRLYREGCMAADNFAANSAGAVALYDAGRAFAFSSCTQNANENRCIKLQSIDSSYLSVELYPLDDACYDAAGLGWSGYFITRNARDPKACIELIQWMYTEAGQRLCEWGREGIDYTMDENSLPVYSQAAMECIAAGEFNEVYNPWFYFGTSAIVEAEGRMAMLEDWSLYKETYAAIRERYRIFPWIAAATPKSPSPEADIYNRAMAAMDGYENKIILSGSDASFEANWEEMQTFLRLMNIQTLETYITARIPEEYAIYQANAKGDFAP